MCFICLYVLYIIKFICICNIYTILLYIMTYKCIISKHTCDIMYLYISIDIDAYYNSSANLTLVVLALLFSEPGLLTLACCSPPLVSTQLTPGIGLRFIMLPSSFPLQSDLLMLDCMLASSGNF